jgi:hypothetical protein
MGSALAMSPLDLFLGRSEGVQQAGRGYRCICAACGGKSRKLSVTEVENGSLLLHCFGGCDVLSVVDALGLRLSDLFAPPLRPMTDGERREARRRMQESGWRAALDVLAVESAVVEIAACQLAGCAPLSKEDGTRLSVAVERIGDCRQVLCEQRRFRPEVQA